MGKEISQTLPVIAEGFKKNQLIEDPDGSELCYCNNCGSYLIDYNPQFGAKKYRTNIASGELVQCTDLYDDGISHDVEYFWGCPNCLADNYLTDV